MNFIHDPYQIIDKKLLPYVNLINDDICLNENQKTLLFLKDNVHLINWRKLSENPSLWSINFCLENENINKVYLPEFVKHNNIKVAEFILNNINYLNKLNEDDEYLSNNDNIFYLDNSHDLIADYILKNQNRLDYNDYILNRNPKLNGIFFKIIDVIFSYNYYSDDFRSIMININKEVFDYILEKFNEKNIDFKIKNAYSLLFLADTEINEIEELKKNNININIKDILNTLIDKLKINEIKNNNVIDYIIENKLYLDLNLNHDIYCDILYKKKDYIIEKYKLTSEINSITYTLNDIFMKKDKYYKLNYILRKINIFK